MQELNIFKPGRESLINNRPRDSNNRTMISGYVLIRYVATHHVKYYELYKLIRHVCNKAVPF